MLEVITDIISIIFVITTIIKPEWLPIIWVMVITPLLLLAIWKLMED